MYFPGKTNYFEVMSSETWDFFIKRLRQDNRQITSEERYN